VAVQCAEEAESGRGGDVGVILGLAMGSIKRRETRGRNYSMDFMIPDRMLGMIGKKKPSPSQNPLPNVMMTLL
jgi:hypothetical protein